MGTTVEEIIQRGIEKGHIDASQKNDMLRTRFWRALFSTELKNATRLHYVQCQDFETLRKKVREEEYEMFKVKTVKVSDSTGRTNVKQDIQHQPLNLAGTRDKDVKDISRRLDVIEKMLRYNRWNRANKNKDQNQNKGQNPNENRNQNQNQNAQNKKEDNQPKTKQEDKKVTTEQQAKKDNLTGKCLCCRANRWQY